MQEAAQKYRFLILGAFGILMFIKLALTFVLFGLLMFVLVIVSYVFLKKINESGIECTGVIVNLEIDNDDDKIPIVEYTTFAGEKITAKPYLFSTASFIGIRLYRNNINDQINIIHSPDDPKKFVIKKDEPFNYLALFVVGVVSASFFVLGILNLLGYIQLG